MINELSGSYERWERSKLPPPPILAKNTYVLAHSAKGSVWVNHKYVSKYTKNGKTYYEYDTVATDEKNRIEGYNYVDREETAVDRAAAKFFGSEDNPVSNFLTSLNVKKTYASHYIKGSRYKTPSKSSQVKTFVSNFLATRVSPVNYINTTVKNDGYEYVTRRVK